MKIKVNIKYTNKAGEKKTDEILTVGGAEELHTAHSVAGRALKFYADSVRVQFGRKVTFKGNKEKGLIKYISSSSL